MKKDTMIRLSNLTKIKKPQLINLEILDWSFSLGGQHFSGVLNGYDENAEYKRIQLNHPLTKKEAMHLNKKDRTSGFCRYKIGDLSDRFETKDDLRAVAIKEYKKHFQSVYALLEGMTASCYPQPVLDGPEPFKTQANSLAEAIEKIGWDRFGNQNDEEGMERLYREYKKVLKKFGL